MTGRGGDRRHSLLLHVPDHLACCCNRIHIILKLQAPLHEMANIGETIDEVIPPTCRPFLRALYSQLRCPTIATVIGSQTSSVHSVE